jgi:hypothetical protein
MRTLLIHEFGFWGANHLIIKQLRTKKVVFSTVYERIQPFEAPRRSAGGKLQDEIPRTWNGTW